MKKLNLTSLLLCFFILFFSFSIAQVKNIRPPKPEKKDTILEAHSHKRIDPYRWMNNHKDPKVIKHLKDENKYTEAMLKHTKGLQNTLYHEMINRIKPDEESAPYEENGYFYYTKYIHGLEYPLYCRKKGSLSAKEEIIINANALAKGYKLFKIGNIAISPNNNIAAVSIDTAGARFFSICFIDLKTNKFMNDVIHNTNGSIVWANDNKTIYYLTLDETVRSNKFYRHTLGNPIDEDKEILEELNKEYELSISKSKSGKYLFLTSLSTNSSEVSFMDLDQPNLNLKLIYPKIQGTLCFVENIDDNFIIRTNVDATNFKITQTPVNLAASTNWQDILPYKPEVLVQSFEVFKNYIATLEMTNGLPQIHIINLKDKTEHLINFEEEVYHIYFIDNKKYDSEILRFRYTSLTTPNTTIDYNMQTQAKKIVKETEIPGGYDKKKYVTKRLFAKSEDGVKIPISLVYKKGLTLNGNNPLLLYGYGAYGNSTSPAFSITYLSLLDRGFVYAIAHVRGGQEMGRQWYEDGRMLKKKNTFTDFITCAEYLIAEKYTNPDKLFANGKSAGGLLMGAITNMKPEIFKGIIAEVPWVDVVSDMLDDKIPLTTLEYTEWGNPNKKEYYDYMLSYSPYDNVQKKNYPSIFATAGLNDSQVLFWNPVKWVAKLRDMKTDKNKILLNINMGAGHSGASGRYEAFKLIALKYAFMLDLLGIKK